MTECFLEKGMSRQNEAYWHNKVLKVHHVKCAASKSILQRLGVSDCYLCKQTEFYWTAV